MNLYDVLSKHNRLDTIILTTELGGCRVPANYIRFSAILCVLTCLSPNYTLTFLH